MFKHRISKRLLFWSKCQHWGGICNLFESIEHKTNENLETYLPYDHLLKTKQDINKNNFPFWWERLWRLHCSLYQLITTSFLKWSMTAATSLITSGFMFISLSVASKQPLNSLNITSVIRMWAWASFNFLPLYLKKDKNKVNWFESSIEMHNQKRFHF